MIQYWDLTTDQQTIISVGTTPIGMTVTALLASSTDWGCDECDGKYLLYNTVLTVSELDLECDVDEKRAGTLIGGTRPPCNENKATS